MAHELGMTAGRTSMAYVRGEGAPWHRLGTAVEAAMTWSEASEAGGLGWTADPEPVFTRDGVHVPGRRAIVRSDTRAVLGVVRNRYEPIQNDMAFGLVDSLAEVGGARYHTVGALGAGETIWLLCRLPGSVMVKGADEVGKYLLLTNSHTGRRALRMFWTPIRVVCANTLNQATNGVASDAGVSIRHRGDVAEKMADARQILGLAERYYDGFADACEALASHRPSRAQLDAYFRSFYPDPTSDDPEKRVKKGRAEATRLDLFGLFESGMGNDAPRIARTSWAAYNAVTEHVDHDRGRKGGDGRDSLAKADRALQSSWMGTGAKLKHRAFTGALAMAAGGYPGEAN